MKKNRRHTKVARKSNKPRFRIPSRVVRVVIAVAVMALVLWPLMAMTASAQGQTADKAIYAEPLTRVVVPGEIALASLGFKGDFGAEFGPYTLKLDMANTSTGISILSWSQLSGQERIVVRLLTDSRLAPGLATTSFHIYDENGTQFSLFVTFMVAKPLPKEFYTAAHKTAVASVPVYNSVDIDGRVQALMRFQTGASFKLVAEIFSTRLTLKGWVIVQNDINSTGGVLNATRGEDVAFVYMVTDPLSGERWVIVAVTQ